MSTYSLIWIFGLILSFTFPVVMIFLGIFIFKWSAEIFASLLFGLPILLLLVWMFVAVKQYQQAVDVELSFDRQHNIIIVSGNKQTREIKSPQAVQLSIHYYPKYKARGPSRPIILLSLDILSTQTSLEKALRFASIQCRNVQEAVGISNEFLKSYQEILNWLNLPIHTEPNVIKHSGTWDLIE